ncbi:MAG: IS30 family transposase [Candidatus Omnitrophica bacterium]|nr:IS30 family transposase [Candidatus Omnitrophota bacterium]
MEQKNCSTKKNIYKHLNKEERYTIEALLKAKKKIKEIASILGRDRSTIYREIRRGSVSRLQYDLTEKMQYRANVGQKKYEEFGKNKERSLRIGKDRKLEGYIRKKIIEDKYSPDAVIGEIERKGLKFEGMICAKTLYNYINAGIFSGISNKDLWEKGKRKKRKYRRVTRAKKRHVMPRRITERPKEAEKRLEYGHWEGDCIKGPSGKVASLLTLTERTTLEEIIIKLEQATQEEVQKAFDKLEKRCGAGFKIKFKTITFDNGSEFLNWKYLEFSVINPSVRRTVIYFAHPYSSWERGSNENQNRIIRRFIPKGTDINNVEELEVKRIENWMNNYPRRQLGYKTAKQMAKECLQNNNDLKLETVAL